MEEQKEYYHLYKRVIVWEHYITLANSADEAKQRFDDGDSEYEGWVEDNHLELDYSNDTIITFADVSDNITEITNEAGEIVWTDLPIDRIRDKKIDLILCSK